MASENKDQITYRVVVNQDEQYSIWPLSRGDTIGWRNVGKTGSKEECATYIEEVWSEMRPLESRNKSGTFTPS